MKKLFIGLSALVVLIGIFSITAISQKKQVWVAPRPGIWKVSAVDEENTNWTAVMRIARRGVKNKLVQYRGYFSWKSEDGETSGREFFNGTFDRHTGMMRLKAYRAKSEKGELGVGNYRAFLSGKGRRIGKGVWSGPETVPGTWFASWQGYK